VNAEELGAEGATAHIVDPLSVQRGAAQGIRQELWKANDSSHAFVTLQPYAVAIVVMGNNASATQAAPATMLLV